MDVHVSSALSEPIPPPSLMVSAYPDPSVVISWVCQQCPFRREMSILRAERGYWQSMYQRAKAREEQLRETIKELDARLKLREQQLFGRKTEQSKGESEQHALDSSLARKRGQQPGTKGHGRRRHEQLSINEEFHELPAEQRCCPRCGLPYAEIGGTEDSDMVEVEVKAMFVGSGASATLQPVLVPSFR
jgi:hypothetical protein